MKKNIYKKKGIKINKISGPSGQSDVVCLWMRNGRKEMYTHIRVCVCVCVCVQ